MKMSSKRSARRRVQGQRLLAMAAAGAGAALLLSQQRAARAATYVWDAPSTPTGTVGQSSTSGVDGSGPWNTSNTTWFNASGGVGAVAFGNNGSSDIAVFGSGVPGTYTVTVNGTTNTIKPLGIVFNSNSGTYNVSGVGLSLAVNKNPFITTNASSAIIGSSLNAASTNLGTVTFNGSGALTVTAASAMSNALVLLAGTGSVTATNGGVLQTNGGGGGLQVGIAAGDAVTYTYASTAINNYNASNATSAFNLVVGANGGVGFVNPTNGQFDLLSNASGGAFAELGLNGGSGSIAVGGTGGLVVNNNNTAASSTAAPGLRVGDGGFGALVVNSTAANVSTGLAGNALVVARDLIVGGGPNPGGAGQVTLVNGNALIGGTGAAVQLGSGASSAGTFNVGTEVAGTSTVTVNPNGGPGVMVGSAAGGAGTLNLNKGTLILGVSNAASAALPTLTGGAGTGVLNLNGGTIQAGYAGQALITGGATLTTNVYNGGLTVATNGFNATITAPLLATSGNGVYSAIPLAPTPTGGSSLTGFTGVPVVGSVSGTGTGTGLTAIADVSNGVLTGFEVTSPGQGYAAGDTLTFTLNGGSTAGQSYTYTLQPTDLAANNAGVLTKVGAGTLTLTGSNTYGGGTNVSAGTLATGTTGSLGTGNVSVGAAVLTLGNGASIGDAATLTVNTSSGSVVNLNDPSNATEVLAALVNAADGYSAPARTYSIGQLQGLDNGAFASTFGTTDGSTESLQIGAAAAPEPTSLALALAAVAPLCLGRRRRSAADSSSA